jgi:hypothetical protein
METVSRRVLIAAALCCFAAAVALTPGEVRSRAASTPVPPPVAPSSREAIAEDVPLPNVDPFVPQAEDEREPQHVPPLSTPTAPWHLGPLPANAGAALSPLPLVSAQVVRLQAVAVGARPSAVIEDGDGPRLVELGDRIGSATITSIDENGISLSDRGRLTLSVARGDRP